MRAVVLCAPGRLEVAERPAPEGAGALVEMRTVGICGTDLKIASGTIPVALPRVVGHELVGTLRRAPGGAFPVGATVLVDPAEACGSCRVCRDGLGHLCPRGGLLGRELDGGAAELFEVAEDRLHPVPEAVDPAGYPLLQVLGTCVHGQDRLRPAAGRPAVVVGLGVSGLLHVQLLRCRGAHPVIGVTRSAGKRALARELGADVAVAPEEAAAAVAEATSGTGAPVVVEAAGGAAAVATATELAAPGGQLLLFGITTGPAGGPPLYGWYLKELTVQSSRAAGPHDYDAAIALAAAGKVRLAELVSARYPFDRAAEAFAAAAEPGVLKVTLEFAG